MFKKKKTKEYISNCVHSFMEQKGMIDWKICQWSHINWSIGRLSITQWSCSIHSGANCNWLEWLVHRMNFHFYKFCDDSHTSCICFRGKARNDSARIEWSLEKVLQPVSTIIRIAICCLLFTDVLCKFMRFSFLGGTSFSSCGVKDLRTSRNDSFYIEMYNVRRCCGHAIAATLKLWW